MHTIELDGVSMVRAGTLTLWVRDDDEPLPTTTLPLAGPAYDTPVQLDPRV